MMKTVVDKQMFEMQIVVTPVFLFPTSLNAQELSSQYV